MIFRIIGLIVTQIINSFAISLLIEPRLSKKKTFIVFGVFLILFVCTGFISKQSVASDVNTLISAFLIAVISCIFLISILSKDPLSVKCFYFITYSNIFIVFHCISSWIITIVFSSENIELYHFYVVMLRGMFYCPVLYLYYKYGKTYIKKTIPTIKNRWWPLSLTALSMLIMMLFFIKDSIYGKIPQKNDFVNLFIGITIECIVYLIVFRNIRSLKKENETEQIRLKNIFLSEQIKDLTIQEDNMRKLRHDFRHHNLYVIECAKKQDYEAIISYLDEYNNSIKKLSEYRLCTNDLVNTILLAYKNKASSQNIVLSCQTKVDKINILDIDLIIILANILENAYNACLKCLKTDLFIEVFIKNIGNKLSIVMNNSCDDSFIIENGIPQILGTGIKSVIDTVNKYQGDIFYQKTDYCTVNILLPNVMIN